MDDLFFDGVELLITGCKQWAQPGRDVGIGHQTAGAGIAHVGDELIKQCFPNMWLIALIAQKLGDDGNEQGVIFANGTKFLWPFPINQRIEWVCQA